MKRGTRGTTVNGPGKQGTARRRLHRIREYGLTAGTLGSTSGQTLMVVLFPLLLAEHAPSAVWIGVVIAGEGLFALLVPYVIGSLSDALPDRLTRRYGRRNFFLLATAPVLAGVLALAPFLDGYWPLAAAAFAFFAAFNAYITPLWALMVDTVPRERWGRVQGFRGAVHAGGLGFGLVGGGLLFALWRPLPFLLAAALVVVTTALTFAATPGTSGERKERPSLEHVEPGVVLRELRSRPEVRWVLIANSLLTAAVDGIRPYIYLFAVTVLGITVAQTSLTLLVLLVGLGGGAVLIGRLGDRFGRVRLLAYGALVTGIAMSAGLWVRELPGAIGLLLAAGLGGAAFIALPYPIFAALVGRQAVGRQTGVYILSVGIARLASPVLIGAAIDLGRPLLPGTGGYPFMWPVAAFFALASVAALRRASRFSVAIT